MPSNPLFRPGLTHSAIGGGRAHLRPQQPGPLQKRCSCSRTFGSTNSQFLPLVLGSLSAAWTARHECSSGHGQSDVHRQQRAIDPSNRLAGFDNQIGGAAQHRRVQTMCDAMMTLSRGANVGWCAGATVYGAINGNDSNAVASSAGEAKIAACVIG
jgi:hypothetical protein